MTIPMKAAAALMAALTIFSSAQATTISTTFAVSEGFTTGSTADLTLADSGFTVRFSGGQQQQFFDGPSYNQGPDAYIFLNGAFSSATGSNDTGLIDFNQGVQEVSFFAANRANGAGVTLNVFGVDDLTLLGSTLVTQTSIQPGTNPTLTLFQSSDFGGQEIGSIGIDLPGPAGNPPYALSIDTFSATSSAAVPEPSSMACLGLIASTVLMRRKRRNA